MELYRVLWTASQRYVAQHVSQNIAYPTHPYPGASWVGARSQYLVVSVEMRDPWISESTVFYLESHPQFYHVEFRPSSQRIPS